MRDRTPPVLMAVIALLVLVAAGCGDDEGTVEASSSTTVLTTTTSTTTVAPAPAPTTTVADDGGTQPGLGEFGAQCREGEAEGCRQLTDATLGEICEEGQTVACQVRGARVGEGDPEGDGTVPFEEGCRAGEFEDCAELSDATLQTICDEGQTAACQTYLARTGEGAG